VVESTDRGISVEVVKPASDEPTKRQGDYLRFIDKYIRQYGRSPAEATFSAILLYQRLR
jgi:hypothetical protein